MRRIEGLTDLCPRDEILEVILERDNCGQFMAQLLLDSRSGIGYEGREEVRKHIQSLEPQPNDCPTAMSFLGLRDGEGLI